MKVDTKNILIAVVISVIVSVLASIVTSFITEKFLTKEEQNDVK